MYRDSSMQRLQAAVCILLVVVVVPRCCSAASGTCHGTPHLQLQQEPQLPPPCCSALSDSREDVPPSSAGSTSDNAQAAMPSAAELGATHFNLSAALHAQHEDDVPADGAHDMNRFVAVVMRSHLDDMPQLRLHMCMP